MICNLHKHIRKSGSRHDTYYMYYKSQPRVEFCVCVSLRSPEHMQSIVYYVVFVYNNNNYYYKLESKTKKRFEKRFRWIKLGFTIDFFKP